MSIDAIVSNVTVECGETMLILEARERGGIPGQPKLVVLNPEPDMSHWIGRVVWGGCNDIMWGERRVAERVGYCSIRLIGNL